MLELTKENPNEIEDLDDLSGIVTRNIDLNAELAEGLEEKYARIN